MRLVAIAVYTTLALQNLNHHGIIDLAGRERSAESETLSISDDARRRGIRHHDFFFGLSMNFNVYPRPWHLTQSL